MFLFLFLFFFTGAVNASTVLPGQKIYASEMMLPLFASGKTISLEQFVKLSPKKYKELTRQKLRFMDRVKLKLVQQQLKKTIRRDGTVNMEKMKKFGFWGRWNWHWGGFALGFLLVLGPIIALFFTDEYKWDRFWTALTVTTSILLVLTAILGASL